METQCSPLSAREAMRSYRARMKKRGMRSIQIWIPDTRSQEVADEMRRQSLLVSQSPEESDVLEFLENISAWDAPDES
ncbi:antitoxin MazE family protein [Desulfonatronum lacustre]|uniref:antitoxin MazE family protein n=1 Tax=Desulfonatronum lacustre TaxID=66849 RepID=UPI0004920A12|nr:antitoxin MazE family protein [Desulfonatronum lacustre]